VSTRVSSKKSYQKDLSLVVIPDVMSRREGGASCRCEDPCIALNKIMAGLCSCYVRLMINPKPSVRRPASPSGSQGPGGGINKAGNKAGKGSQTACKPGSVPVTRGWPFIWDVRCRTPHATDPGDGAETRLPALRPACRPYLVLLPVGFAVPSLLPGTRCALTAPFHPYRPSTPRIKGAWRPLVRRPRGGRAGGLLSVALSLGSPPPGVTRHRVSMAPGLSSPRTKVASRRRAAIRPSDS